MNTEVIRRELQLPFPGLYESTLSMELDNVEEQIAENEAENRGIDASTVGEALYWSIDYQRAHVRIAQDYAESFSEVLKAEHEIELELEFKVMDSPKEYNFTTDRLFVTVPDQVITRMRAEVRESALRAVIIDRHSSYSGFWSFYSNDLAVWNAKPLAEWDHNELSTLLLAYLNTKGVDMVDLQDEVIEDLRDHNKFAIDEAVLEAKLKEAVDG
jgi:hypothetical protein